MKTRITSKILKTLMLLLCTVTWISAQQTQIEHNSSADPEDPQLLLLEVGDSGAADGSDGWSRMWFKNSDDAMNRWGFLARPHNGAVDNQNVLASPLVMAYTGVQKFGFGKDGNLVINKNFILPNTKGTQGQALVTTNQTVGTNMTSVVDWGYMDYIEKNATIIDPTLSLHENSNDAVLLSFSNDQFPNNRFFISADPSTTTGTTAKMNLGWGSTNGPIVNNIITLDGSTNHVGIGTDPYESFRLHVEGPQAAAHFGPKSASFPAVGYVTVNRPTGNASTVIFKVRNNGATVADFDDNDITFFEPTTIREDFTIINGDLNLTGGTPGVLTGANAVFSGTVTASCGVLSCSDVRYKKNITEMASVLDKIKNISGVFYDWDTENFSEMGFSDDRQVGVIAQELEAEFPELVKTKDDGYKVVAYDKLAPIVLQAVKEQQEMIDKLMKENNSMREEMTEFRAQYKALNKSLVQNNIVDSK